MRPRIRGYLVTAIAFSLLGLTAHRSGAMCDAGTLKAARDTVNAACDCASFTNHGQYVKCVANAAKTALPMDPSCRGAVVKCAARSTCGKPGFVTCCRTSATGVTKCSTKSSGDHCKAPNGGSSCFSVHTPSCCDACLPGGGCASSPSGAFLDGTF